MAARISESHEIWIEQCEAMRAAGAVPEDPGAWAPGVLPAAVPCRAQRG